MELHTMSVESEPGGDANTAAAFRSQCFEKSKTHAGASAETQVGDATQECCT